MGVGWRERERFQAQEKYGQRPPSFCSENSMWLGGMNEKLRKVDGNSERHELGKIMNGLNHGRSQFHAKKLEF